MAAAKFRDSYLITNFALFNPHHKIEKVWIIKNFEEANFSDFKRLVVNLKINPQMNNWPQTTCKLLNNTFPDSNWSVLVMRIEQSEVYNKV